MVRKDMNDSNIFSLSRRAYVSHCTCELVYIHLTGRRRGSSSRYRTRRSVSSVPTLSAAALVFSDAAADSPDLSGWTSRAFRLNAVLTSARLRVSAMLKASKADSRLFKMLLALALLCASVLGVGGRGSESPAIFPGFPFPSHSFFLSFFTCSHVAIIIKVIGVVPML